ncbi:hypothetical protein SOM26_09240 [Sphingomonas sp. CFBP8993]|uniref:hypothetical protein n=1 Tax=Sphingomonas sp. CFBP8993 TaxID=3096526 RepID=UPI002A6B8399|nr:hypothetical protein [Sphingomonas sp. CFBP8993]MDY0958866.1 hypothetical protein [Sphingomonas sp. CFBP8993]
MIRRTGWAATVAIASTWAIPGGAQTMGSSVQFPGGYAPGSAPCVRQADGSCVPVGAAAPLPVAGKQESLILAAANSAAAPQVVYGGAYVFGQACGSYNGGTLALRYRGPDGVAMLTLLTRGSSDAAGGAALVTLGSHAIVDVVLPTGATECAATLARVP